MTSKIRPDQYFVAGQIVLGLGILLCVLLIPHYFFSFNQGGVSNFGADGQTKWLFTIGFGAAALGSYMAAVVLPGSTKKTHQFKAGLIAIATLYLLILFSTFSYKQSEALRQLHEHAAELLFVAMLVIAFWLRSHFGGNHTVRISFILFGCSLLLAILNQIKLVHLLFMVELGSGVSFAFMTAAGLKSLTGKR